MSVEGSNANVRRKSTLVDILGSYLGTEKITFLSLRRLVFGWDFPWAIIEGMKESRIGDSVMEKGLGAEGLYVE